MRITEDQVHLLAQIAGMDIAPAHLPGVIANLETLLAQAELLFAEPIDASVEPAPAYRP